MNLLLDTPVFIWWDEGRKFSPASLRAIETAGEVYVSSASAWEICTKHRLGRLPAAHYLVRDVAGWVQRAGFAELPIGLLHAQRAGTWPQAHRDPFDRMLAAQSALEDAPLISRDGELQQFGIRLVW